MKWHHGINVTRLALNTRLAYTRVNLRYDMQFELTMMGNERIGAEPHGLMKPLKGCSDDEFILQKNMAKINGEFKMPLYFQSARTTPTSPIFALESKLH